MPRHPSPASAAIRSVACPLCGAKPGQRCVPVKPAASWTAGQSAPDHKARRDVAAVSPAGEPRILPENPEPVTEAYQDLLGSIWLYIDWRYVTRQLTTPQKELFADAVDRDVMRSQAEDGEEPRPVAERWWRDA